jgi:hypothetical protein
MLPQNRVTCIIAWKQHEQLRRPKSGHGNTTDQMLHKYVLYTE